MNSKNRLLQFLHFLWLAWFNLQTLFMVNDARFYILYKLKNTLMIV